MAKSKLQRLGKEEVARRVKIKRRKRMMLSIKIKLAKLSVLLNLGLVLHVSHLHGTLIPFLTNIYVNYVAPIMESILDKLPI